MSFGGCTCTSDRCTNLGPPSRNSMFFGFLLDQAMNPRPRASLIKLHSPFVVLAAGAYSISKSKNRAANESTGRRGSIIKSSHTVYMVYLVVHPTGWFQSANPEPIPCESIRAFPDFRSIRTIFAIFTLAVPLKPQLKPQLKFKQRLLQASLAWIK